MRFLVAVSIVFCAASAHAQSPYGDPPYAQDPNYPQQQYQQDPYAQDPNYQYEQQQEVANTPAYGYVGPHPEPYEYGNSACLQTGVHFHPYPPFDQYLFRQNNGYFYFVGDLGDFGYQQQLWGYQGNHPIPLEWGGGYCYMEWPHRHHYAPPSSMAFRFVGGYYSYYGPWDSVYWANRASWLGYYNGYYRSSYYGGRYWTVRPSPVYRVNYGWGHPGVYRPGMTVRSPSGVTVTVGGWGHHHPGGVVVGAPRPGYVAPGRPGYVAPPPSRPGYVAPPPSRPGYVAPPPSRPGYVAPPPSRGGYVAPPPGRPSVAPAPAPAPARRPVVAPPPPGPQRRHF